MKKIFLLCLLLLGFSKTWGQTVVEVNDELSLRTQLTNYKTFIGTSFTINISTNIVVSTGALPTIDNISMPRVPLTINGENHILSRETTAPNFRVLEILAGNTVIINNLTIANGIAVTGAGISNAGNLTLNNCTIRDNTATSGVPMTSVSGGGIYNTGSLKISQSTINNNIVTNTGGVGGGAGAGIFHSAGNLEMTYCTVSGNQIQNTTGFTNIDGAGIYLMNSNFQLNNISVVSNINASGLSILPAFTPTRIQNSLFLNNSNDIRYVAGTPVVDIRSQKLLFTNTLGSLTTDPSQIIFLSNVPNIISTSLRDNGGVTQTHALVASSLNTAIEGGTPIVAGETDQRGETLLGTNKDIGAYEFGTFWVTTTADNNTNPQVFSLREAVNAVNATTNLPNLNGSNTPNRTIKFKILNNTAPVINLTSSLNINKPVIIDGTTQLTQVTNSKKVELNGAGISPAQSAIVMFPNSGRSEIYGLISNRFLNGLEIGGATDLIIGSTLNNKGNIFIGNSSSGIFMSDNSQGIKIEGNQIGWDYNTLNVPTPSANFIGITISPSLPNTITGITILKNSIAGNTQDGISIQSGTFGLNAINITENLIGLASDATETVLLSTNGIRTGNTPTSPSVSTDNFLTIDKNTIGASSACIVVGNFLFDAVQPIRITNNKIGVKSNGTITISNGTTILVANGIITNVAPANPLTASLVITGNTIAGVSNNGIDLQGVQGTAHTIEGNFIGTNANGDAGLGNGTGILISNTCNNLKIGGTIPNTISSNTIGVSINANGVEISNNYIGTKPDGNNAILDNAMQIVRNGTGIFIASGLSGSTNIKSNIISGNTTGIDLNSPINNLMPNTGTLSNNMIGLNIGGTARLANLPAGTYANTTGINVASTAAPTQCFNNVVSDNFTAINWAASSSSLIQNNKIGLNNAGDAAIPNNTGIIVSGTSAAPYLQIRLNSIATTFIGMQIGALATVSSNNIGVTADGLTPLTGLGTGAAQGISIVSGAAGSIFETNTICSVKNSTINTLGTPPYQFTMNGTAAAIRIADNNITINGNLIGITSNGTVGANDMGIIFPFISPGLAFGGNLITNNIISNNTNVGIFAACNASTIPNTITNNAFGMKTNGLNSDLADNPTQVAITLDANSPLFSANNFVIRNNVINKTSFGAMIIQSNGNTIGGTATTDGNLIGLKRDLSQVTGSNIGFGLLVGGLALTSGGNNNTIQNNRIANCGASGIVLFKNSAATGTVASGNTVLQNNIFSNAAQGINVSTGTSNRISQNSIHSNGSVANFSVEKGIDLNINSGFGGNNEITAPTITNVLLNSPTMGQVTIYATFSSAVSTSYDIEFFYTDGTSVSNVAQVEGQTYLGTSTVTATTTTTDFSFSFTPSVSIKPTDYITATLTSKLPAPTNTSEFSTPYLICSTTITGITTRNIRTNCQGSLTDVRIGISTTNNLGTLFNVDTNGDGAYEFSDIALQNDANGRYLLLTNITSTTFFNTRVFDQTASCTSSSFVTPNAIVVQNNTLPRPSIISARVVQPTRCDVPNGQLIVKIQNGNIGQFYELSTNGVFGAEASGLVLGTDSTLRITNLSTSAVIGNLEVYQSGNQCFSNTFAFAARMTEPNRNIDTTLAVTIREDEISPNFNTVVSLATSQDSISYRLRNKTNGVFVGQSQVGNRNTLSFNTDTLRQAGTYIYEIVATDIRTGCSRILGKTVSVQVISGILQEELDLLREVYNSTNGNNWTVRWDFSQNINTFIGVSIFGGRVTTILLPNNNLTGTLTSRVLSFRRLRNLDISRNRLDFGSVENNIFGSFTFKYDLQDKINTQIDTTAYADTQLALRVITQGNFNTYQWQKDGQNIPNATNAVLFFNALKLTDAGVYTCIIRNSRGTALTLERRAIRVRVNQKAVTALDLTLLRELNVALGGANWKNKWIMDGSVPVAEWYGITMEGDKIKSINLANNNLVGTIPDNIPLTNNILSDLIYLNLSGNKITGTIPKSLGNLSKLQYLDISDNLLRGEVIAELGKLTDLNTLWIAKNSFTTIHPDLGKLQNLENLFAHFNLFTIIPTEIGGLIALKKMNFNDNLLKNIPATLGNLVNLENLSLANNVITDLPNTFGGLGKLQELYLQNNQLAALPSSFISLRSLTVFNLHTNLLDFADFEPLANLPVLNADGATYEPQIKVGTTQEILFTLDQKLDFTQAVNGNANTYQWFKNGVMVSGATSLQFLRNFINLGDAGTYTLQIKNTITRKLTLLSRDIVITISCGNSSSVNINVGGTSRYCEGETINTLLTANITTGVNVAGYQWLRGNAVLANETQKTLSIIQAGDYKLQVRDNNGCVFLSPVVKIEVLKKPTAIVSRVGDSLRAVVSNAIGKVSFAWYQNNTLMSNEKTQSILAKTSGLYYVVATDEQNCPSKSPGINFVVTGIEDELSAQTVIYPNPSSNQITVIIPDNFTPKNVKFYNMLGQEQSVAIENNLTENKLMLNIENLASGVYQLELVNQKGEKIRKKVVKQ